MPPGSAKSFEPGRDVDAVAKDVAILDDDVALVDADAELDAALRWQRGIAFGHCRLHFGRASERVDDAGKLDQQAVAGGLDDAALMVGDLGIDQIAAERLEPAERPFFIGLDQPRIAGHIGGEDRGETADGRHGRPSAYFSRRD